MKLSKSRFHTFSAVLALGALSIGFAPAASAMATYDAAAEFTLTLASVTDLAGGQPTGGWEVYVEGFDFDTFTVVAGDATADFSTSLVDPGVVLGLGDTVAQSSMSTGSATDGYAESLARTDLGIDIENFSDQDLRFTFSFDAASVAEAVGDAIAYAVVGEVDENGALTPVVEALADGLDIIGPPSAADSILGGPIELVVPAFDFAFVSYAIDSDGSAYNEADVPEPATLGLLAAGLIGAGAARRRKSA